MVPESSSRPPDRAFLVGAFAAVFLTGCEAISPHEMLNAVLWQQHSAEYRALALQSYELAATRLDEALLSPGWSAALEQDGDPSSLPPAVILDLDETVIDNARYEAGIVARSGEYSRESFARWCESGSPSAVPGVTGFIRHARDRGVAVFYYSAREEGLRGCTLRVLEAIGLGPVDPGSVYLRGAGSKTHVRGELAARYRITLLIGDNLEDFINGSKVDADGRRALVERHASWFGRRWIVLPNPVYGHWEALYYGFDYAVPRWRKLERKRSALTP